LGGDVAVMHNYGHRLATHWVTLHDTAVDGITPSTRTPSSAAEAQSVLHFDPEPRVQFTGSVRSGVLDRHPPDLHTTAPPLGVPHVVVSAPVLLGMVRPIDLDQHRSAVPNQEEVRHPDVARPDSHTGQWRNGESTLLDRRGLQSD
jgi:hypothetical protein